MTMNRGAIQNQPDESKEHYYDQEIFDDPLVGPNMHQVNSGFIKPYTAAADTSYAVMLNGAAGGVRLVGIFLVVYLFCCCAWGKLAVRESRFLESLLGAGARSQILSHRE